jgi:PPK2 family polyphosphate:nucleotide phosphotransferase
VGAGSAVGMGPSRSGSGYEAGGADADGESGAAAVGGMLGIVSLEEAPTAAATTGVEPSATGETRGGAPVGPALSVADGASNSGGVLIGCTITGSSHPVYRAAMSADVTPAPSPYLVPFDGSFDVGKAPTRPPEDAPGKKDNVEALEKSVERLAKLQEKLYADDRFSLLIVFQALDAAGKDGTLRAVMSGVNPAGCHVTAFKAPSAEELDHDFLWRCARALPERGRIGIWNRSHYEEVLVVRVHPKFLEGQRLPAPPADLDKLWQARFESIRNFEEHLARSGTVVLKFWLNVSKEEQRDRMLDRIDEAESNWKFNAGDLAERRHWPAYMQAYQEALRATSRPWAPWYAIPADSKSFMRRTVADIIVDTLARLPLRFPEVSAEAVAEMKKLRAQLAAE